MYKTPAERHEKQRLHEGSFAVNNKLQQYLRDKFDPDTARQESTVNLLKQIAKDYDLKVGIDRSDDDYTQLANEAIDTFCSNYKKHPAGYRQGSQLSAPVVTTLCDMR